MLCDIIERQLLHPGLTANQALPAAPAVLDPLTLDQISKARTILTSGPVSVAWAAVDEAELRLFSIMPDGLLKAELTTQVARAEVLGVVGLVELKAAMNRQTPETTADARRNLGVALLQRNYNRSDERRLDRIEPMIIDKKKLYTTLSRFLAFLLMVAVLIFAIIKLIGAGKPVAEVLAFVQTLASGAHSA